MELSEIIGYAATFVGGGGLMKLINLRQARKKGDVEVKLDEIQVIHNTIEKVYQPIIDQQNKRIQELETEVRELRIQLTNERNEHQADIDLMNKRILAITEALGITAADKINKPKRTPKK